MPFVAFALPAVMPIRHHGHLALRSALGICDGYFDS
jgi:hypothetical protein